MAERHFALVFAALAGACAEDDLASSLSKGACDPAGKCASGYQCNSARQCVPMADAGTGGGAGSDGGAPDVGSDAPCANCLAGEICCDDQCTKKNDDPSHCGSCGNVCPGTTCQAGTCTNDCLAGLADCNKNVLDGCEAPLASCPKDAGTD